MSNIKPHAILVDLDGTLADIKHRLYLLQERPKNHRAFEKLCVNDEVNFPVCLVVKALESYADIVIVSGRSSDVRKETEEWLQENSISYNDIYMRKSGDYRADNIIKDEILMQIKEKYDILFAIDDRKRVVDMWKRNGIFVFDVRQTDVEF